MAHRKPLRIQFFWTAVRAAIKGSDWARRAAPVMLLTGALFAGAAVWLTTYTQASHWAWKGWERMFGPSATANAIPGTLARLEDSGTSGNGTIITIDEPNAGTSALEGTIVFAVNASGVMTGAYSNKPGIAHGFVYADGTFTPFDAPNAGSSPPSGWFQGTTGIAIDTAGDVVGISADSNNAYHGILREANGTLTEFDDPNAPTATSSRGTYPMAINDAGQIVGFYTTGSYDTNSGYHGFVYSIANGAFAEIDDPSAGTVPSYQKQGTVAMAISASGTVAGYYADSNGNRHGFIYSAGNYTSFDVSGATTSTGHGGALSGTIPMSIDAAGDVVGSWTDSNQGRHGFIRSASGTITTFDAPGANTTSQSGLIGGTFPTRIDPTGSHIVGGYTDSSGLGHGFVYYPASGSFTTFTPPNMTTSTILPQGGVFGVNAAGTVVGFYLDSHEVSHGFEYTPTLSPTTTTTTLTASSNPATVGQSVTFTAAVTPNSGRGTPTGSVVFSVDGMNTPTVTLNNTGHASYTTKTLAVGTHTITASYSGDANDEASNGSLAETIVAQPPPPSFEQIAGLLVQIAVGADGSVWGINSAQSIFTYNPNSGGWTQIPGELMQIAVGSSTAVWGINAQQQIYRFDPATQNWDWIPGSLSQIAVGADGDVWGINGGQQAYHYVSATQSWEYIPTTLTQIAVGFDGAVWGLGSGGNNSGRDIYRFNVGTRSFEQMPGDLSQIAVGADGDVWGVNAANGVYHFNTLVQNWEQIQGGLSQISVGSAGNVWGVNPSGNVYTFNTQAQNWTQILGTLTQVSAGANGSVWGVDSADDIYQFVQPLRPTQAWHAVPGQITQVTAGADGNIWALDGTTAIFHYNPLIQNWENVPGGLSQIAVGFGGDVWGINSGGFIYRYNASIQNWENVPGELSQIAVGANGDVWGINSSGYIYRFDIASLAWEWIPGELKQLSVGADGAVWGINSAQNIFTYNPNSGGWTQIPGELVQIAVGSSSSIWGLNAEGYIYHFNLQTQNWDWIPGNLSQIAIGFDGTVWGINSASQIFRYDSQAQTWDYIPGALNQITVGADAVVWGVNSAQAVYRFW